MGRSHIRVSLQVTEPRDPDSGSLVRDTSLRVSGKSTSAGRQKGYPDSKEPFGKNCCVDMDNQGKGDYLLQLTTLYLRMDQHWPEVSPLS